MYLQRQEDVFFLTREIPNKFVVSRHDANGNDIAIFLVIEEKNINNR